MSSVPLSANSCPISILMKVDFPVPLFPHDAHLLIAGEDVGEIIQYLQVAKGLIEVVCLEYLAANIGCLYIQLYIIVIETLLGYLLQFIKSIFPVTCLMPSGFAAYAASIQAPYDTGYWRVLSLRSWLRCALRVFPDNSCNCPLYGIYTAIVYLDYLRADAVEEVAVVRHHQQSEVGTAQIIFQPFGHIKVEVVGRLIQYKGSGSVISVLASATRFIVRRTETSPAD